MNKITVFILCIVFAASQSLCAQNSDPFTYSIAPADTMARASKSPYQFRAAQLIAPGALIAAGATGLFINPVKKWNQDISNSFAGNKRKGFDDYVQYVPFAAPYVLKLCGVKSRHTYGEYTVLLATSYLSMGIMVNALKYSVKELRPDGSSRNSFPSGHTATAFMGAELLRAEFWETSPWIGVGGYAIAVSVGYMRLWHNRHWMTDVLAGAGIGILSVRIAYWTFPTFQKLLWGKKNREQNASDGYASFVPYYDGRQLGAAFSLSF